MNSIPYQPLVPGLDALEGLYVAKGAAGKIKIKAGVAAIGGHGTTPALIEQTVEEELDSTKELTFPRDGVFLVYVNAPTAKNKAGSTLAKFSVDDTASANTGEGKEVIVNKVNIINSTAGETIGRSRVLAKVTVAGGVVTAIENKARFEIKYFPGTFTAMAPAGTQVANNNLDKN